MEFVHAVNTELSVNENVSAFMEAYRKAHKGTEPGMDEVMSFMKQAETAINAAGIASIRDGMQKQQKQIDELASKVTGEAPKGDAAASGTSEKAEAKEDKKEEKKGMSTTTKVAIGVGVTVAVGGGVYVGYKAMKKKDSAGNVPLISA